MSNIKTKGIVIRQTDYGEANRMLTIFTEDYGIIKVAAHGVKRIKSRQAASSQFLCYSDFVLYTGSEIATVNSASPIDSFFPIQEDIKKLALGTYLADIVYWAMEIGNPDRDVLRLLLNCLYAIAYKKVQNDKVKAVFELRVMALCGFMPNMRCCSSCGTDAELKFFSISENGMVCRNCMKGKDFSVSDRMYSVMCYSLYAPDKRLFAFDADEKTVEAVGAISEKYVAYQLDRQLDTLVYYKKI